MADNLYRRGDAITFLLKNKPFIDLSIPPSAQDYRDACCVTWAIYDTSINENLISNGEMTRVPNRPGWYFTRYQTERNMATGLYVAAFTVIVKIDGVDYTTRSIQEFKLVDDGIV